LSIFEELLFALLGAEKLGSSEFNYLLPINVFNSAFLSETFNNLDLNFYLIGGEVLSCIYELVLITFLD